MSLEVRPLGVKCNIQCRYCYQDPQRFAGNLPETYDINRIKAEIEAENRPFTLFGGEPLMMPMSELEALWSWGFEKFGRNSVQTNGVLINKKHIVLFNKYRVRVGISVDGPGELNRLRWAGGSRNTARATQKTHAAIALLCEAGIVPGIIVTLHRVNAAAGVLPGLIEWFRHLDTIGIRSVRLHALESENDAIRTEYGLSEAEQIATFAALAELERQLPTLKFDVFRDMRRLLSGRDNHTACVWNACDPYSTRAVQGVEGDGQRSNCGRTNKDGIDFVKADEPGFERYVALYHTPQDYGGCQGCRFFLVCKGQCPGTALDGDWRNRTEHCGLWKHLYSELEAGMVAEGERPLSLSADRGLIEDVMMRCWSAGHNPMIETVLRVMGKEGSMSGEKLAALVTPRV